MAQRRIIRLFALRVKSYFLFVPSILKKKIILGTSKWDETCWLQYPEGRKFMTFTTES